MNDENCPDGYKNGRSQTLTHPTTQHTLESGDLFASANFLMSEQYRGGVVEQFKSGVAIAEEKILMYFKVYWKIVLLPRATAL